MAISTRMSRNPVTPSAQAPSTGARPSSSRPSSVKNSMAASMSSTTMPTLSIRLTVTFVSLTSNDTAVQRRTGKGAKQPPVRPLQRRVGRRLVRRYTRHMIHGAHVIIYSKDAEADRAFLRDVLKYKSVDAGHGWLIFALPPAEVA